jgi:ornithine cyclodeaminase/alanine dehydrogenase-like protein (mu-crystallin family)
MTKIRTALVSAIAISSLLAGGVAVAHVSAPRPAHHVADEGCCGDMYVIGT